MKKMFVIASALGLAIPASLSAASSDDTPFAKKLNDVSLDQNENVNQTNEISQRISSFYVNEAVIEGNSMLHTNSHTDVGGNHTNYHSNLAHTNTHTNKSPANACGHTDVHSDRSGNNSHTDRGRSSHTNHHTNRDC